MQTITEPILFTRGVPPQEALPAARISECMATVLEQDGPTILQYGNIGGYPALRQMLAADFGVETNQILIGNGSLHLQDLFSEAVLRYGDLVLVEQPSYDRAIKTFRRRGAQVQSIPLESDGVNLAQFEAAVRKKVPAFVYLIPDFQNPAGVTMSEAKRQAVVEMAEKYDFWLIEDVPYRTLRYTGSTPPPLLHDIHSKRVITMSSYSKLISPALRVGFMVGPADIIAKVTQLAEDTILTPVLVSQAIVAEFRRRNWLEPHVNGLKDLYAPRLHAMLTALDKYLPDVTPLSRPEGGFFVSLMLPPSANYHNLLERAKNTGLVLTDGRAFFADPSHDEAARFVRLPFPAITPTQIEEGVKRLATLL